MDRRRDARRLRARANWVRVTAAASSAALLGTLGLAGTSMAATSGAAHAAQATTKARVTGDAASSCHLGATAGPPALRNAIYAATGVPLRRLPIDRRLIAGKKA